MAIVNHDGHQMGGNKSPAITLNYTFAWTDIYDPKGLVFKREENVIFPFL